MSKRVARLGDPGNHGGVKNYDTVVILWTLATLLNEILLVPHEEFFRKESFAFRQTSSYEEKEMRNFLRAH